MVIAMVVAIVITIGIVIITVVYSSPSGRLLRRRECEHEGGLELSQSLGLLTSYDKSVINEEL
jgi:hypothetical protein